MGCHSLLRGSSRLKPESSTLQADSLLSDPPGKPINSHKTPKSYSLFGHQTAESHCQVASPLRHLVLCRSEASVLCSCPYPAHLLPGAPASSSVNSTFTPRIPRLESWGRFLSTLCPTTHSSSPFLTRLHPASKPASHPTSETSPVGISTPTRLSQHLQAILPTGINTDLKHLFTNILLKNCISPCLNFNMWWLPGLVSHHSALTPRHTRPSFLFHFPPNCSSSGEFFFFPQM